MLKNRLTYFLFYLISVSSYAQSTSGIPYAFSTVLGTASPFPTTGLTNITLGTTGTVFDEFYTLVSPAGMNVPFGGVNYQKFVVSTNGWIALVPSSVSLTLTPAYTGTASAASSGTTINVSSTAGLSPGMLVQVTSGTGTFVANTYVISVVSGTQFTVGATPAPALAAGATITAYTESLPAPFTSAYPTNNLTNWASTNGFPLIAPYWDDNSATLLRYSYSGNVLWVLWQLTRLDKSNVSSGSLMGVKIDGTTGIISLVYSLSNYTPTTLNGGGSIGIAGICAGDYYSVTPTTTTTATVDSSAENSAVNIKPGNSTNCVTYNFTPNNYFDNCASARFAGTISGTCTNTTWSNVHALAGTAMSCTAERKDVWFSYLKPAGISAVKFTTSGTTCGSAAGTTIEVYASCGGASLGCSTTGTTFPTFGEVTVGRPCAAETLYVKVTVDADAIGKFNICTTATSFSQNSALNVTATAGNIICNGGSTSVIVNASGGTAPYTNTGTYTVNAGTYSYVVTDANNCSGSTSITISEPTQFVASINTTGPILCNGGSTTVSVTANGGTLPYTGTGNYIRTAGTYTFTVTDNRGCISTAIITITQPSPIMTSANSGTVLCSGGTTTVLVAATGGTGTFVNTGLFTVTAGTYNYTVFDANNCSAITSTTISQPSAVIASANSGTISCNGGSTTVIVSAIGGIGPYSNTGTFTITAGSYTYTVTDANGCTSITSITITQPSLLIATASAASLSCNGGTTTTTVTASGGSPLYNGTGVYTVTSGNYTYTVTDTKNCIAVTSLVVSLTPNSSLNVTASIGTIACNGGTTTVSINATGGSAPYSNTGIFTVSANTYTFTVTDANNCSSSISVTISQPTLLNISATAGTINCNGDSTSLTISANGGTSPYTNTGTYRIIAGTYTYTVTDHNGCNATNSITVTQPLPITANIALTSSINCYGESALVIVNANGGSGNLTGIGTYNLYAGTSYFTVTDLNGCSAITSITITQPNPFLATYSVSQPINCFGGQGTVNIAANGGIPPYSGNGAFSQSAGTYTYFVIDNNGCSSSVSITLTQPSKLELSVSSITDASCIGTNGSASVIAIGGIPPYNYFWNPGGQISMSVSNLSPGNYQASVTDQNGCTNSVLINISQTASAPSNPSAISGPTYVCRGTSVTYSVTNVAGVVYNWSIPPGVTGSSTTNAITLSIGSAYAGGQLCVTANNICNSSGSTCLPISVSTVRPATPIIIGPSIVCGSTTQQYIVAPIPGATSYNWSATGTGVTILSGNGTNSILLSLPAGFGQGLISVYASSCIGNGNSTGFNITGTPTTSNGILGSNLGLCAGTSAVYSIVPVIGTSQYIWTSTGDATVTSNANNATMNFGPNWNTGSLTVTMINSCGSFSRTANLRAIPTQPGSIFGNGTGLCNSTQTYSIDPVNGASNYSWTTPVGLNLTSNGTSATVTFPSGYTASSSSICVTANNNCGSSVARCFSVTTRPAAPTISGPISVCTGGGNYSYTCNSIPTATLYSWSVTTGGNITSSGNLSATVNYLNSALGIQTVRVTANNACGPSNSGALNVNVNACRESVFNDPLTDEKDFTIFPNPCSGSTNIIFDTDENQIYRLEVCNLLGDQILVQDIQGKSGTNISELNLNLLQKGLYLVKLYDLRSEIFIKKVIVE